MIKMVSDLDKRGAKVINISARKKKRVMIVADKSSIEPLGPMFLGGVALQEDWEPVYVLVNNQDYSDFPERVKQERPDVVGFSNYTGNHLPAFDALDFLRKDHPNIVRVAGGHHATYFSKETLEHAHFVVKSEGLDQFRQILRGEADPGILGPPIFSQEEMKEIGLRHQWEHPRRKFPLPDRKGFYLTFPEYAKSPIKSIITMTGC